MTTKVIAVDVSITAPLIRNELLGEEFGADHRAADEARADNNEALENAVRTAIDKSQLVAMSEEDAAIVEAAKRFGNAWAELACSLVADYDCTMNCDEANALAGLLRALGQVQDAEAVMKSHAAEDDEGDEHYQGVA